MPAGRGMLTIPLAPWVKSPPLKARRNRLGQAQGYHREVDALEPQDRPADRSAHRRRIKPARSAGRATRTGRSGLRGSRRVAADHRERTLGDIHPTDRESDPDTEAENDKTAALVNTL